MCGIAGIFSYHYAAPSVSRDELITIRDYMESRGPDGKGEWFSNDSRVGLGHRRLAIVDLNERASQPMSSNDGKIVLVFNGEIYNFHELRRSLESYGYSFKTTSDTEVVLRLYEVEGESMLKKLRGMFAIAIWDARKQALLLARDPFGIKPLYYSNDGWCLRFASQVKALLSSEKVSRSPNPAGIVGFHLFGSVPEPYTLYQDISAVPAGSFLWIDSTGVKQKRYYFSLVDMWDISQRDLNLDSKEILDYVRCALHESVCAHMVADVPVGAFLSSGVDSGAIVGLMSEIISNPAHKSKEFLGERDEIFLSRDISSIKTITVGFGEFKDTRFDEIPLAKKVADLYGTDHRTRIVTEREFADDLPKILLAMDQPSIDGVNSWFVCKAASEIGLKVAISGVGGDELFGGYPSFQKIPLLSRLLWIPSKVPMLGSMFEQVQTAFSHLYPKINPKTASTLKYAGTYEGSYFLVRGLFMPHELSQVMDRDMAYEGLRRLNLMKHITSNLSSNKNESQTRRAKLSSYSKISILETSMYLRNQLLRDTDWASMAHSLEVRTPFIDINLVSTLAKIINSNNPVNWKNLLGNVPSVTLPSNVKSKPKTGFLTPIADWQKNSNISQSWKQIGLLNKTNCQWARRWSKTVLDEQRLI